MKAYSFLYSQGIRKREWDQFAVILNKLSASDVVSNCNYGCSTIKPAMSKDAALHQWQTMAVKLCVQINVKLEMSFFW
jgi:hypothetical protein